MTTITHPPQTFTTVADLLDRLGGVAPSRVRMTPAPGTATEADVAYFDDHEDRLYELVDGILVEKVMGLRESLIAGAILHALRAIVIPRKLGIVSGEAGMLRLFPGQVRIPDVAYISRERLPGGTIPDKPAPAIVPDIAVEVLSNSNTIREMARKRQEYFAASVRLVWEVDLHTKSIAVYTSPETFTVVNHHETLTGGDVLPDFRLPLDQLFAEIQ